MKASAAWTLILLSYLLPASTASERIEVVPMGELPDGEEVLQISLRNDQGLSASVMTWGATLIGMHTPDRDGNLENITLHLGTLEDYLAGHPLFGSTVGRFANRIDTGGFTIDGERFDLATFNARTGVHIHGGKTGFQRQNWKVHETWEEPNRVGFVLSLVSPHGHEGYPGTLRVTAGFSLDDENRLTMTYQASTDRPTHVNLTNHAYWNLGGATSGSVLNQHLQLGASHRLEFDDRKIPTGKLIPVVDTPYDFRKSRPIGDRLEEVLPGYDHCYALDPEVRTLEQVAARLSDPDSGRVMEVRTSAPGIQLYTANYLKPTLKIGEHAYGPHHGVCLECQHFPDTPNQPDFPTSLLRPGQIYRATVEHRFSVMER